MLTKETRTEKTKKTLRNVIAYADEVARDEQLRAAIRAAAAHGSRAGKQAKKDIDAGSLTRLAQDEKLRRNLREMLDDLDNASDRIRPKKRHRVRNVLLTIAAAVGAVAALSWARERMSGASNDADEQYPTPTV